MNPIVTITQRLRKIAGNSTENLDLDKKLRSKDRSFFSHYLFSQLGQKRTSYFRRRFHVRVTYFHGQSPGNYRRRTCA